MGEYGKLSGKLMQEIPKDFGTIYSKNITHDNEKGKGIGKWSDADIAHLLRTGCKPEGSYLPIYMPKFPHLSDYDLKSAIAYLRSDMPLVQASSNEAPESNPSFLVKFLCRVAFKKLGYPKQEISMPDTNNLVAYGRYLTVGRYDCWTCHSSDFKTLDFVSPEKTPGYCSGGNTLITPSGSSIFSANITPDEKTGIGTWIEEDFKNVMHSLIRKDGKALRAPMLAYNGLTDNEIKAIWQYLLTVPKVSNEVNRQWDSKL
ncbi:MAG: hypothetical protein M9931_04535 [Chitinophagales bacterium]|nr:hypothetical protein [Chitinophagales bacterium]